MTRHFLRLLTVCLALALGPIRLEAAPDQFRLTILHTNDVHGHLLPFAYTEVGRSPRELPSVGGAARRATLVRALRRSIHNPTMLIDSGDIFTRGPLANAYEGIADAEVMNAMGYELAAVGNNEFKAKDAIEESDAGGAQKALLKIVKRSYFPWVCANAVDKNGAFLTGVKPYVVRNFGGVRVGFLGLTAPRSASYPQTRGWTISDPVAAANLWIPRARAHCDILIAVTHIGMPLDVLLAMQTQGLDAIIGGDSHTFLYKPLVMPNRAGIFIPIVQDGEFGVNLGRFDLRFVRDSHKVWHLAAYQDKLLPIRPTLAEAPDVTAVLAPYVRPFQTVVGHLTQVGATSEERTRLTTQIVADALRYETGADLALSPNGSGFFEVFRHRAVTRYDVYAVMPFKNHAATVSLTGTEARGLLKAVPSSVVSGDLASLKEDQAYSVAFVDFNAKGDYRLLPARVKDTGKDLREVVISYLKSRPGAAK